VVAPAVLIGVRSAPLPAAATNVEPVTGAGWLAARSDAIVVAQPRLGGGHPTGAARRRRLEGEARHACVIVAQFSRNFLYARAQSIAAYVSGTPNRMPFSPPTLT
jgi:hypothetical protein